MPDFSATCTVTLTATYKVCVEAETEEEALALIEEGEWDDCIDTTDENVLSVDDVEFY